MVSESGAISLIPLDRLTVMMSGRKGHYETPYGVIEFTHTKRPVDRSRGTYRRSSTHT